MDNNKVNPHAGGVSIIGLLTVVFIALKLTGVIKWSWIWVLSPIWIYVLFILFIAFIAAIVIAFIQKEDSRK